MLAQITATEENLKAIDYTRAKITNLYMVNINDCYEIVNKPVTFQELRKYILQTLYTPDLLDGHFNVSEECNLSTQCKPVEFCGWTDGTDEDLSDMYDGARLSVYMYRKSANGVMKDVLKALPINRTVSCSINITLQDGHKVTINENFPNTARTSGWNPSYVDFATRFVMA
jgi:hypothetical protein